MESKEQTPIEEFLENELTEMYHNKEMSYDTYSRLHDLMSIASEEEVKAKVLEALDEITERFKENIMLEPARIVIETEVKPKYKL